MPYHYLTTARRSVLAALVALMTAVAACSDEPTVVPLDDPPRAASGAAATPTAPANGPLVFASDVGSSSELFSVNQDGSGFRRLTFRAGDDRDPAVSPDGKRIAYARDEGSATQVYVMNVDGSGARQLTALGAGQRAGGPAWSPDGKRIAFSVEVDNDDADIYVMSANGRNVTAITDAPDDPFTDVHPSWSPDGRQIAFTRVAQGFLGLAVMNADGTNVQEIGDCGARFCLWPEWAPDGSGRLAYVAVSPEGAFIAVKPPGQPATMILGNAYTGTGGPAWSPDGKRLVAATYVGSEAGPILRLRTVDALGGEAPVVPLDVEAAQPSWARQR